MMEAQITREIGYYWVHFGRHLRDKGLTNEWLVSFWNGTRFVVGSDEWTDDCFDSLDETRIVRNDLSMQTSSDDSLLRNVLINTSVEVKTPIEYGMTLAAYMIAGAEVWAWHKGYKPLDKEECPHHLYGWEECGFLKHAGIAESTSGDFKSPLELINVVKQNQGKRS